MPSLTSSIAILVSITLLILLTALLRILYILPSSPLTRPRSKKPYHQQPEPQSQPPLPLHLLIVLGSGGHTAEMLSMLSHPAFDPHRYTHRTYLVSAGDAFSADKAVEFESRLRHSSPPTTPTPPRAPQTPPSKQSTSSPLENNYTIHTIPRARMIHQPLLTTPLTSLRCLFTTMHLLLLLPAAAAGLDPGPPDLILTNGPGTGLIVILADLLLRAFPVPMSLVSSLCALFSPFASPSSSPPNTVQNTNPQTNPKTSPRTSRRISGRRTRTIYIESWARTRRPSLTGRLIVRAGLCDRVLVQWPRLAGDGWGEYRGVLVR